MLFTVDEAAHHAGRSPDTVRRWIRSGKLRSVKIGPRHYLEESELTRVLGGDSDPLPTAWERTWTGEPQPDWVGIIRRSRVRR